MGLSGLHNLFNILRLQKNTRDFLGFFDNQLFICKVNLTLQYGSHYNEFNIAYTYV